LRSPQLASTTIAITIRRRPPHEIRLRLSRSLEKRAPLI
jgi:hypothetical protein